MSIHQSDIKVTETEKLRNRYNGKLSKVQVNGFNGTISGIVDEISDNYIVLKHKDGRRTTINRAEIAFISEVVL